MEVTDIEQGVITYTLVSWREFPELIEKHHANSPALIYRGQADAEWKIESTLDRWERRFPETKNTTGGVPDSFSCSPVGRETHLRAFKEAVRGKRGVNPPILTEEEWWALAQQHGLATPMLDWTYYPFVALFFAFEEALPKPDGQRGKPRNRAVYAVSSSVIYEKGGEAPRPFCPRGETSYRLINQGGVFIRMPKGVDLEQYVRCKFADECRGPRSSARAILHCVLIPDEERIDCLKFLNKMNINRMSLFPDLDGAARHINGLWELDWDTSIGHILDELPPYDDYRP